MGKYHIEICVMYVLIYCLFKANLIATADFAALITDMLSLLHAL